MLDAAAPPLRIGIMVNSHRVRNWVQQIIDEIQSSDYAKIELVILNGSETDEQPIVGFANRLKDAWRRGIFNRFHLWDTSHYRRRAQFDAFVERDITTMLKGIPTQSVVPVQTKYSDRFTDQDIEEIASFELDVILRFGFRILRGDILKVAKHGIWSYHHGDNREYRGGPALFWEIYERNPLSGSTLQILTDDLDGGHVIYRSESKTEFNSLFGNRNSIYWKTAQFMPRRLKHLHQYGWSFIESLETFQESDQYDKEIYRAPSNFQMCRLLCRRFFAGLRMQSRKLLFRDRDHQWFVAIRRTGDGKWIHVPCERDRFYADPFPIEANGKTYLFVEELPFATERGVILVCEVKDDCSLTPFEVALDLPNEHLSYPHVFEHHGEYYMTPESSRSAQLRLYRAKRFPFEWEQVAVLIDGVSAVDPTIHIQDGIYYLFCNIAAPNTETWDDELHIYSAKDLLGPWKPHPLNPVVSNVGRSRPAGRLYVEDGKLLRPSQDCSQRYGYAITINRVDELSESTYSETPVEKIEPAWAPNCIGTHMTNRTDKFEVRDGAVRLRRWRWER